MIDRKGCFRRLVGALIAAMPLAGRQDPIPWSGYVQVRFAESRDLAGFSIRRTKLWLKGPAPVGNDLYYKELIIDRDCSNVGDVRAELRCDARSRLPSSP